jgi:hypothetical protein
MHLSIWKKDNGRSCVDMLYVYPSLRQGRAPLARARLFQSAARQPWVHATADRPPAPAQVLAVTHTAITLADSQGNWLEASAPGGPMGVGPIEAGRVLHHAPCPELSVPLGAARSPPNNDAQGLQLIVTYGVVASAYALAD